MSGRDDGAFAERRARRQRDQAYRAMIDTLSVAHEPVSTAALLDAVEAAAGRRPRQEAMEAVLEAMEQAGLVRSDFAGDRVVWEAIR